MLQKPKAVHINNDDNNKKQSNSQNVNVQIIIIPERSDGARSSHTWKFPRHKVENLEQQSWSFTRHLDPTGRQNNGILKQTKKKLCFAIKTQWPAL